jgi:hypothetical protein
MELHPRARKFYAVNITVTPVVSGNWQASFDNGETWVDGSPDPDVPTIWRWLMAGPLAETIANTTVLSSSVDPLLRIVDSSEVEVVDGPPIYLTIPDRYPSA